jgi:site-specific DNA-adenine methylase
MPVGSRDFNNNIKMNCINFINTIKNENYEFKSENFENISISEFKNNFVYADPPYLITNCEYDRISKWNEFYENKLYELLDKLTNMNIKFALSNVLENKGNENIILKEWIELRKYNVHFININYYIRLLIWLVFWIITFFNA